MRVSWTLLWPSPVTIDLYSVVGIRAGGWYSCFLVYSIVIDCYNILYCRPLGHIF